MSLEKSIAYVETGHQSILESIRDRHQFVLIDSFKLRHTFCGLASTPMNDKIFIKIKGYPKTQRDKIGFRRAVKSNRMAGKIKGDIRPRLIEFRAFERENIYWITSISAYAGKPISSGYFFTGDDAIIDRKFIARLRHSIEVIQKSPSAIYCCRPEYILKMIADEFGSRIPSVPVWSSAHCDFHWGNILEGVNIVDWDMFSLAPKGYDLACILLFSSSNPRLFKRLHREFSDMLDNDTIPVAVLFAASYILRVMNTNYYSDWKAYEPNIRKAVRLIVDSD